MAKKGSIKVPAEMGSKGIPPGLKTHFPKKRSGITVPSELGDKGMPKSSYPGSGKMDPRLD